jgi:dTDP-4-amino-4,6-dideoxygalactose transaminase
MAKFKRMPIVGTPIALKDLGLGLKSLFSQWSYKREFEDRLVDTLGSRYCISTGSGKTAFYVILKCLSQLSTKKEVILPAYTDAGLVLVIRKLGLKTVFCDISLDTFNLDAALLSKIISQETLCIVAVHMFGLVCVMESIFKITRGKGIFVIEDCAQAMGASINGRMVGTIGDAGFYSFNRGKNFPTHSGGCITTNSKELAEDISREVKLLKEPNILLKLGLPIKLAGFSLAVRPKIYGLFYPFIAPFKNNRVPRDFTILRYTNFQAALGLSLLKRISEFSQRRYENGSALINGLKDMSGILLPKIVPGSIPVFNRLPVIFKDIHLREKVHVQLLKNGIEASYMYTRSLPQVFDIGYRKDEFPNANYLAQRILTLPTHPLLDKQIIIRMIDLIKEEME